MIKTLWEPTDLLIFTTNAVLKKDGSLVMGRGIARAVRDSFEAHPKAPEVEIVETQKIDRIYGYLVKKYGNLPFIVPVVGKQPNSPRFVMSFPTKEDWRKPSSLSLIQKSRVYALEEIKRWRGVLKEWGAERILCPLWGTENGKLPLEKVEKELKLFGKEVKNLSFKIAYFNREGLVDIRTERERNSRRKSRG